MRYLALACDYDETLAPGGHVDGATIAGLERVVASGRKLILMTGRLLEDLQSTFPGLELFDWVVAENGGVLYQPSTREEKLLGDAPAVPFTAELFERGVSPLEPGRVIVSTREPHESTVLAVIKELG